MCQTCLCYNHPGGGRQARENEPGTIRVSPCHNPDMKRVPAGCCVVAEYGWIINGVVHWYPFAVWWPLGPDDIIIDDDGRRHINSGPYCEPDWERLTCGHERPIKRYNGRKYYNRTRRCPIPTEYVGL